MNFAQPRSRRQQKIDYPFSCRGVLAGDGIVPKFLTGEAGMPELVRFPLEDGGWAVAQLDDATGVMRAARGADGIFTAGTTFDAVMAQIRGVADTALRGLRDSLAKPDEIEIEFGVALNAQAGAVMGNLGAHLQVRLSWKKSAS
jgi:hypothetical protein